ncbi:hypothetical protein OG369_43270 [Streptomyces sp. NBC_01221]|uniref:hypothetical protein n=1 Tax=Streptomyces sp. NBC_01221 TaxID=2903782 RepID=UPI002259463E|nr:hypothetical protein [Streptomyces sp. NBC_01221]MCX4792600.1 hypothetical protein [Streptomyces sp. NBC_01221]
MNQIILGVILGATATALALATRRRLSRRPHCGWCATASSWPTSQHDALQCRGYVQERRREHLRDTAHARTVPEPNPWGNAHLLDEEIDAGIRTPDA